VGAWNPVNELVRRDLHGNVAVHDRAQAVGDIVKNLEKRSRHELL
jgi:hypothetical protein